MTNKGIETVVKTIKAIGVGAVAVAPVVVTVAKKGVKETVKVIKATIGL
ncbi:MAG: hypothetical protein MR398_02280 [Oscillospiraceae bacterium]|nr:hypothetical protein [Oscillospiraceae bacterium]